MKLSNHERSIQHAFDSFCKKVLKNELRDHYREIKRQRDRQVLFSEMSAHEEAQLCTKDSYFAIEQTFDVLGKDVVVTDASIAKALQSLPEQKCTIILMSYYLKMSDPKIADALEMARSTVCYQRTTAQKQLRELLEKEQGQDE